MSKKNEIQKLFTDKAEGNVKSSGVQTLAHIVSAVGGAALGAAVGRPSLFVSVPIIFAGKYLGQEYVTSLGAGMAANVTTPKSVNGLNGVEGIQDLVSPKAALERFKGYAKELKHAAYLGETPEINSYSHYLSESDSDVYQLPQHNMSQLQKHMEGLADNLDDFDAYLEGEDEEDGIVLKEVLQGLAGNLQAIQDTVQANPELLEEGTFDEEAMDVIEGLAGIINGASMAGLSGNDDDFLEEVAEGVGALEGIMGIDDDDEDDDDFEDDDDDLDGVDDDDFEDDEDLDGFDDDDIDDDDFYNDDLDGIYDDDDDDFDY